jgi:uncharacterized protein (DUF305 family)
LRTSIPAGVLAALTIALALALGGCGDTTPPVAEEGLETDSAYLTVLTAQNENAIEYSKAIVKTTKSDEVEEFASKVIEGRNAESDEISKLQQDGRPETATLSEAAETLGFPLSQFAISADGQPLTSPSTDQGYVKAMKSNANGVIRASNAELKDGSPEVMSFARLITSEREDELDSLKELR